MEQVTLLVDALDNISTNDSSFISNLPFTRHFNLMSKEN